MAFNFGVGLPLLGWPLSELQIGGFRWRMVNQFYAYASRFTVSLYRTAVCFTASASISPKWVEPFGNTHQKWAADLFRVLSAAIGLPVSPVKLWSTLAHF